MRFRILLVGVAASLLVGREQPSSCSECATWNTPQKPFRIYGNTYYVGTHGLASVLITSLSGHVLIDGALSESVPQVAGNVRALGFRVQDIKLIVNSHAHFDHAGGISELQNLSGARVLVSSWTADVMKKGTVPRDDPQFGIIRPIARVANVGIFQDGEAVRIGSLEVTPHMTAGHTPGGTSWTWKSCEGNRCLDLVYGDSLTPISADGFLFSRSKEYPHAMDDFERSYAFLEKTPCDILITPHPEPSNLWQRLEARSANPNAMIDRAACRTLAATARERLKQRLAKELGNSATKLPSN